MQVVACYKLTPLVHDWIPGQWRLAPGSGGELCSPDFLHAYPSALAACFLNAIHANIRPYRLWKAEGLGQVAEDAGLKIGCKQLRIMEELIPPKVDQEHRIRLGLMASLHVCGNPAWRAYAHNYIDGPKLKFVPAQNYIEPDLERVVRTHAWLASQYEDVERNSALATQTAAQYKGLPDDIYEWAWGHTYIDTPADGRSVEDYAFRSAPHD